jgi:hypothetical protein
MVKAVLAFSTKSNDTLPVTAVSYQKYESWVDQVPYTYYTNCMGQTYKYGEDGSASLYRCPVCGRTQRGGARGTCGASIAHTGYNPVTRYKWADE